MPTTPEEEVQFREQEEAQCQADALLHQQMWKEMWEKCQNAVSVKKKQVTVREVHYNELKLIARKISKLTVEEISSRDLSRFSKY